MVNAVIIIFRNSDPEASPKISLQELRPGGQPKDQTGRPGQDEEECEDPGRHTRDTVQEDSYPLD